MGEHVYMALNRITVWKFDAAPAHFQRLHDSSLPGATTTDSHHEIHVRCQFW
jgi:hypothetical protein